MSEERKPIQPEPEPEQRVEDLDVREEESEDVKGGQPATGKVAISDLSITKYVDKASPSL